MSILCTTCAAAALAASISLYPSVGVISDIQPLDDETELITVDDGRNTWEVEQDIDDLFVGDIVAYVMCDGGTPANLVDDEIVPDTFRYIGYVKEPGREIVIFHGSDSWEVSVDDME